jgi:hypothetical protein
MKPSQHLQRVPVIGISPRGGGALDHACCESLVECIQRRRQHAIVSIPAMWTSVIRRRRSDAAISSSLPNADRVSFVTTIDRSGSINSTSAGSVSSLRVRAGVVSLRACRRPFVCSATTTHA